MTMKSAITLLLVFGVARSMDADEYIAGDVKAESFDQTAVLVTGYSVPRAYRSEVLLANCSVPDVPKIGSYTRQAAILTPGDSKVLYCGTANWDLECVSLEGGSWKDHSRFAGMLRINAYVTMPDGVYLFAYPKSLFLPRGSSTWQDGPQMDYKVGSGSCGVRVSDVELVLTGGDDGTEKQMMKYNTQTRTWTKMPNLLTNRTDHGCAFFNEKIIISGGYTVYGKNLAMLASTEVHSVDGSFTPRMVGNLNTGRDSFRMVTLNMRWPRLLAIGGLDDDSNELASIEEWDDDNEEWKTIAFTLKEPRSHHMALAVPPHLVCNN